MSAVPQSAVPASSLIDRSAHALLLTLAMSVLLAPAAGLSWLAAGLGLVLAAWPLVLAEQALAARARKPLLSGMQVLTREADAARGWRVLSWSSLGASLLAMALVALTAGALATQSLQTLLAGHVALPAGADLWPVLTVLVLLTGLLRPLGRAPVLVWLLPALMLLALAFAGHLAGHALPVGSDLALSASLPASAGLLYGALVPAAGLGLHWQLAAAGGARPGLGQRIPVLVLAGLLFAALQMTGLAAALLGFIVCLLAITALAQPLLAVGRERGLTDWMALVLVFVPVIVISEAVWYFGGIAAVGGVAVVLAFWLVLNQLVLAVFAGWVMKISHVRKALQLPSEAVYNVWRVAIRWVAPMVLLTALVQMLRAWSPV